MGKQHNKDERLIFTKEMKEKRTILLPQMLPIHFRLFERVLRLSGYKTKLLETTGAHILNDTLPYVHNDICYPAMLAIGQLMDGIRNSGLPRDELAVMITQTGGGCRASNYIHLLRKAMERADMEDIPVISLNLSGLEKNPGFKLSIPMMRRFVYAIIYGDILMLCYNRQKAYERRAGDAKELLELWEDRLAKEFEDTGTLNQRKVRENLTQIVHDFDKILITGKEKPRVGVVGEIYIKFAPLGNNNLEDFLASMDCEVIVPGLLNFLIFKADNRAEDVKIYGGLWLKKAVATGFVNFMKKYQNMMNEILESSRTLYAPGSYDEMKKMVKGYLGYGNKMGEGWLLTGEMLELIHMGVNNIVCTQPFGCLPNHIVGKGMMKKIRHENPGANIVAVDYDPGAAKVNQENRIRLMLANARLAKTDHN